MKHVSLHLVALAAVVAFPTPAAWSFPPYRSTDAETAEPGALEIRLGLLRVEREDHDDTYSTPLLRANLGLVENLELVSELEYQPEEGQLTDGAVGLKGVTPWGPLHVGIETLVVLQVSSEQSGVGVESQLVGTWRRAPLRLHVNAGGFYDPRSAETERGWRAEPPRGARVGARPRGARGVREADPWGVGRRASWAGRDLPPRPRRSAQCIARRSVSRGPGFRGQSLDHLELAGLVTALLRDGAR